MRELTENPSEIDKYLFSLLELLRTKYNDVSVNRGRNEYTFLFTIDYSKMFNGMKPQGRSKERIYIRNGELLGYFMTNEIPKEIKMLIEEK